MTNYPMTRAEAEAYRYMHPFGRVDGDQYNPEQCAFAVDYHGVCGHTFGQCSRRPGHGPDGLYCAQHAKMIEAART